MALLELKGFGVRHGATKVAGIDLAVEAGTMLAVVGRGDGAISLLALALAGLLPKGAVTEGTLGFAGTRVLYLDRHADASTLVAGADLIVADEPGRERDPATQLALLKALQGASRTAAVIIFTADFRLPLNMGLEVAVIAGGKLLLKAAASQIFELPQYDTVRHLVGGQRLRTRTLMRPPIGEPILELAGVGKTFRRGLPRLGPPPVEALKGIGFAVRQGEVVGVIGPGGAGKTTLLRLIAGLDGPSAGHVGRRPGLVGFVFSDPRRAFNPTLPVGVSLTEPLRVEQTLLVEEQADRLVEVVRAVGLEPELLTRLPGEFGTADLQRMALARALMGRPSLLLMDDPTAVLDPAETREFLVLFSRVRADFGLTAIVAAREFEVGRAVADRLLVLEAGHIVEGGKPSELLEAPNQEITRRLVSGRYPPPFRPEDEQPDVTDERPVAADEQAATVEAAAVAVAVVPVVTPESEPEAVGPVEATAEVVSVAGDAKAGVAAPSTALPGGPPPPLHGGESPTDSVAEPSPEPSAEPVGESEAESIRVTDVESTPVLASEPAPEPEPTHGLSATIIIAPVVLADPVVEVRPVAVDAEISLPPEPMLEAQPAVAEAVEEPEAPLTAAVDDPAPPPPDGAEVPLMEPEPQPSAEPVIPPSGDGADEAAEGGEAQGAVGGRVDTAGSADAPDGEAGR
jgi:ABC-type glutathione transport system ATPase component